MFPMLLYFRLRAEARQPSHDAFVPYPRTVSFHTPLPFQSYLPSNTYIAIGVGIVFLGSVLRGPMGQRCVQLLQKGIQWWKRWWNEEEEERSRDDLELGTDATPILRSHIALRKRIGFHPDGYRTFARTRAQSMPRVPVMCEEP